MTAQSVHTLFNSKSVLDSTGVVSDGLKVATWVTTCKVLWMDTSCDRLSDGLVKLSDTVSSGGEGCQPVP